MDYNMSVFSTGALMGKPSIVTMDEHCRGDRRMESGVRAPLQTASRRDPSSQTARAGSGKDVVEETVAKNQTNGLKANRETEHHQAEANSAPVAQQRDPSLPLVSPREEQVRRNGVASAAFEGGCRPV